MNSYGITNCCHLLRSVFSNIGEFFMAARFSIIYDITECTSNGCSLNTMNVMHSPPCHALVVVLRHVWYDIRIFYVPERESAVQCNPRCRTHLRRAISHPIFQFSFAKKLKFAIERILHTCNEYSPLQANISWLQKESEHCALRHGEMKKNVFHDSMINLQCYNAHEGVYMWYYRKYWIG